MQPQLNFISIVALFGIIQGLFLVYFFLTKPVKKGNLYFIVLLFALILLEAEVCLNQSGYMLFTLHLLNISPPLLLLIAPVIYLYINTLLGRPIVLRQQLLHFFPFFFYFLYSFFFFLQPLAFKYNAYMRSYYPEQALLPIKLRFPIDPFDIQGIVIVEGIVVQMMVYAIWNFYLLHRYFKMEKKKENKQIAWLILMNSALLLGGVLLFLSEGGIINGKVFFKAPLPQNASSIVPCMIVYALSFFLIKDSGFFHHPETKYQKSGLSKTLQIKYLQKIEEIFINEKPYLKADFSLGELAQCTGIKTHHISQVINTQLNISFYELINLYRIKEAQQILQHAPETLKIEPLAYQLGYKSKSAFFTSFKKYTSVTPAQYRQQFMIAK